MWQGHPATSGGISTSGPMATGGTGIAARETELVAVTQAVEQLNERVASLGGRAEAVANRVFGYPPPSPENNAKSNGIEDGTLAVLRARLGTMLAFIEAAERQIERLERL